MTETLSYELKRVQSFNLVSENLIGLSAERQVSARWTDLYGHNFVVIHDLSDWISLIAIPKVYWRTLS